MQQLVLDNILNGSENALTDRQTDRQDDSWLDNEFLLQDRIQKIQQIIAQYGEDNFYISFSGGKDSTVLSALIDMALPNNSIPRVYANTGIELNMIRDFDEILSLAIKGLDQEPNTWSLDDAREDFMHDVYNELDFLPTNEEANRIIDIFDRVTSSIEQAPRWIPVTERLPEEMFGCLVTVWDANPKTGEEFENILPEFAGYDGETWNGADGKPIAFEVVAWLPLPEAYKAEGEV